jgi:hypothetical protein
VVCVQEKINLDFNAHTVAGVNAIQKYFYIVTIKIIISRLSSAYCRSLIVIV